MQVFRLHKCIYKLGRYSLQQESLSEELLLKKKLFNDWEMLKRKGLSDGELAEITGISRATYYRRKKAVGLYGLRGFEAKSTKPRNVRKSGIRKEVIDLILRLRRENPTYGKAKIAIILKRDYQIGISESSTGRILSNLLSRGLISRYHKARYSKKSRQFKAHAKRWKYGMKAQKPGEMVQIDHMSVSKNNLLLKHFQAWDPITKVIVADVASNAKSITAAKFLRKLIAELPFKLTSIQVDGGSEFMKDFEQECAKLAIPLFVLPPKRPQFNGGVERGNRTFRDEFYCRKDLLADSIGAMRHQLSKAVHKYNSFRPHFNLKGLTPYEYNKKLSDAA